MYTRRDGLLVMGFYCHYISAPAAIMAGRDNQAFVHKGTRITAGEQCNRSRGLLLVILNAPSLSLACLLGGGAFMALNNAYPTTGRRRRDFGSNVTLGAMAGDDSMHFYS